MLAAGKTALNLYILKHQHMEEKRIKAINDAMSWIACMGDINKANAYNALMCAIEIHGRLASYVDEDVAEHFNMIVNSSKC